MANHFRIRPGSQILGIGPPWESLLHTVPSDKDVRNWMATGYPAELSALQAAAGNPIEIGVIQNAALARALHGLWQLLSSMAHEITELKNRVNRRTAVFTPARGFSADVYHRNALRAASEFLDHDVSYLTTDKRCAISRQHQNFISDFYSHRRSPNSRSPSVLQQMRYQIFGTSIEESWIRSLKKAFTTSA
ncbi:hypothetical protein B0H14DRAFT_2618207 [Mycena olivaceomarginata]|nr:hypothetical protein B0H14DRAFT_2618207 [Mycena olivaceomarginata]